MLKKQYAALILLSVTLFACQKKAETIQSDEIPPEQKPITVRLLTDANGVGDKSFNASAWLGILDFYGDTISNPRQRGVLYDWVTAQNQDLFIPNLRQATDEGYDLIINTGFAWASPLRIVATDNPQQKYLLVDVGFLQLPNVMQAVYAEHEGSYLVGVAAALKAKEDGIVNPRFGFIGGVAGSVITKFEVGYVQGILSVIPNAQIIDYYVNSFGEPALAKTQAKNWYDSGVYAIFTAAGASGNGTIAQAKEYRAEGRNVWAIGVDSDMFEEGIYNDAGDSAVLTSMVKRVENSALYALNAVSNNTFKGEVVNFDLKIDGVGYSAANPALSAAIIEQLEIVKAKIIGGEIRVVDTLADAVLLPGFSHNLRAIDD
jgi:basic membrane protein A